MIRISGTIISTVGASLIYQGALKDIRNIDEALEKLYSLEDPLNNREFGAEINSVASLVDKGYVSSLQNAYFLVSDTEDGRFIGEVLKRFFKENPFGLEFNLTDYVIVEDLDDLRPHDFRTRGLRNLIKEMARLIRNHPDSVINATGGYKAQIALATALGQALKVPVYYRFERFPYIVELPPLPLTLSKDIAENYKGVLLKLECSENGLSKKEFLKSIHTDSMAKVSENLKFLIDVIDGRVMLSPMGQIYFESVVDFDHEELERMDFLVSDKSPKDKISFSEREAHALKILKNNESIVMKVADLKLVDLLLITGSSTDHTADKISVKVMGDHVNLILATSRGTLHMEVFSKCSSFKVLQNLVWRIEEILKG